MVRKAPVLHKSMLLSLSLSNMEVLFYVSCQRVSHFPLALTILSKYFLQLEYLDKIIVALSNFIMKDERCLNYLLQEHWL